jgi:hypothetical protein
VALLISSITWDLLSESTTLTAAHTTSHGLQDPETGVYLGRLSYWTDHIDACRALIHFVRTNYPHVNLLWRSPTTQQIHIVKEKTARRCRYMSNSRVLQLFQLQQSIMNGLNVPFVDIFSPTYLSGHWHKPGDGPHFLEKFNRFILNQLYLATIPE